MWKTKETTKVTYSQLILIHSISKLLSTKNVDRIHHTPRIGSKQYNIPQYVPPYHEDRSINIITSVI